MGDEHREEWDQLVGHYVSTSSIQSQATIYGISSPSPLPKAPYRSYWGQGAKSVSKDPHLSGYPTTLFGHTH
jgi:hypothetical protein